MSLDWQKIMDLAKRTGDRLIVCNEIDDSALVVMDLAKYEQLLARSEWNESPEEIDFGGGSSVAPVDLNELPSVDDGVSVAGDKERPDEDFYYLEPVA